MFPFHKIYSALFKSFDIKSDTETILRLKNEGVTKIMIIKRSWIFGLAMVWIPLLILFISACNIYISYFSYKDASLRYSLLIGVGVSLLLFLFSAWNYLSKFRKVYDKPRVSTDVDTLLKNLDEGDRDFIRFFDQTILNQWIIVGLVVWSIFFYFTHPKTIGNEWIIADCILLFLQWILLGKYRKRMMDMEMDYNIATPGKIFFVNQSGMLSSSEVLEGDKIKTITASYPSWVASFFEYGTIEIMTEGGDEVNGVATMYYVPSPNETARIMQSLINREGETPAIDVPRTHTEAPLKNGQTVGPKEISYDVKGTVRDVLR